LMARSKSSKPRLQRLQLEDVPWRVPLLAIALVAALGLMPALIFKFLDSRAERQTSAPDSREECHRAKS
jgi:hypothetical protein